MRRLRGSSHIALFLTAALLISDAAHAGRYDPAAKWQTIRTPNFKINYPKDLEEVAQKAAQFFEEAHAQLSPELEWKPWPPTEVVLVDSLDEANGFAAVLPHNWIILYVVPPRSDSAISNYDDWLRLLITHEYTHILHMDKATGIWKPFRILLGKIVAPAGILPVWIREGFATYEETKHTQGGRGRSTFTDMLLRTAVLEKTFLKIDQADGFQWEWPTYNAAYLYGVAFIQYLVDTYGEEKFLQFNKRVQRSLLLTMINHQAKKVYGKTFYQLWREWHAHLQEKYQRQQEGIGPTTPLDTVVSQRWHERYLAPAVSPDGKWLVYTAISSHREPQIRLLDLATGKEEVLRKKQGGEQIAWLPDSSGIVYASETPYKRYSKFFDLWTYELKTKKVRRLTGGARARDPAVDPKGENILFVAGGAGIDRLKVYHIGEQKIEEFSKEPLQDVQFSLPQWSPDGERIVISMHTKEQGWQLVLFSKEGALVKQLTKGKGAHVDPVWSKDGKQIMYSSDETGVSNIYRITLSTGNVERVSNVITGLFHPTLQDEKTIIVQHYHSGGFDVKKFEIAEVIPVSPSPQPSPPLGEREIQSEAMNGVRAELELYPSKKYNSFGKSLLLPRFISPNIFYNGQTTIFSLNTLATDPLRWHQWSGGVNYRLDAKHLGYEGQYVYNRYRPFLGGGFNDYVVNFGRITFDSDGNLNTTNDRRTVTYFEERRGGYVFAGFPIQRHVLSTSYFYEDHLPKTSLNVAEAAVLNTGKYAGMRLSYAYGDYQLYPASISLEDGRRIRLLFSITDSTFGSGERNEQRVFSGDWREYIRLWRHHVVGLRAAGGVTFGDRLIQGTFAMGGSLGEGALSGGGSLFYLPLRGLPVSSLSRTNALLFSSEYRVPFVSPQRGLGTTPIYLKNIHGAVFADYGNAWNDHERGSDNLSTFFDDFFLGVGVEARGDFVVGHGLPLLGRVGYAIIVLNRDRLGSLKDDVLGTSIRNGVLIVQLGTSF